MLVQSSGGQPSMAGVPPILTPVSHAEQEQEAESYNTAVASEPEKSATRRQRRLEIDGVVESNILNAGQVHTRKKPVFYGQ